MRLTYVVQQSEKNGWGGRGGRRKVKKEREDSGGWDEGEEEEQEKKKNFALDRKVERGSKFKVGPTMQACSTVVWWIKSAIII